jgi:hypothetical protein
MTPLDNPRIPRDLEHKLNEQGYRLPEDYNDHDVIYGFAPPFFGPGEWKGKSIVNDKSVKGREDDYIRTDVRWLVLNKNNRHEAVTIYVHKRLRQWT